MKTLYDVVKLSISQDGQSLDEKEKKELENLLHTRIRELKDCIHEFDTAEKIKSIKCDTIKFVSYVDVGGCGNSGELFVVTQLDAEVTVYCFDCSNETSIDEFQTLLPWLSPFLEEFNNLFPDIKMFEIHPRGWKHCYLGVGNHLFINDDIYHEFLDQNIICFIKNHQHSKLLKYWKNRASEILGVNI